MAPIMGVPKFPKNMADGIYYTNDGTDTRYHKTIFAGDKLHDENGTKFMEDRTVPGSDLRVFAMGGDLEGNIIQGCPSEIVLPSREDR